MKAMLLTAGLGTRLRPLTLEIAKPAIPLLGKPLVVRLITKLMAEGISDFRLNLHHLPETIEKIFGASPWNELPVSFSYEPEIMGTAGGLKANESFFANDTFLMVNGDIVIDFSIQSAVAFHKERGALATLILIPQQFPFQYFPVRIDVEGRLRNFKGMCPGGDLRPEIYVFTGIHILDPKIFNYIPGKRFSEINDEVYPAALANNERIFGFPVTGYWNDLGHPVRYLEAQKDTIVREKVNSKAFIAGNVSIPNSSRIGPFVSIGTDCVIEENVNVENTIVWNKVHLKKGTILKNCIVGNGLVLENKHMSKILTRYGEASIVRDPIRT